MLVGRAGKPLQPELAVAFGSLFADPYHSETNALIAILYGDGGTDLKWLAESFNAAAVAGNIDGSGPLHKQVAVWQDRCDQRGNACWYAFFAAHIHSG